MRNLKDHAIADQYKDSGDQNLGKIFLMAAQLKQPCVLIIDELQTLIKKNKSVHDSDASMLTTLWSLLDTYENSQILFVGTLNPVEKEDLPEQIMDRFHGDIVQISLPNEQQRLKAIQLYTSERMSKCEAIRFEKGLSEAFARKTDGCSYRKLIAIIKDAIKESFCRNSKDVFVSYDDCMAAKKRCDARKATVYPKEGYAAWVGSGIKTAAPYVATAASLGVVTYFGKKGLDMQNKQYNLSWWQGTGQWVLSAGPWIWEGGKWVWNTGGPWIISGARALVGV